MNVSDLIIFQLVAQTGSFSKAAQQGYMTAPAILYRINELEKSLGVKLFNRTSHGVTLTSAGKVLESQSQRLVSQSEDLVRQVRNAARTESMVVRIGSSLLNPANQLMDVWQRVLKANPNFRLQFTPLETLSYPFPDMYQHLGEEVDLLYGPYGFGKGVHDLRFYPLRDYHFTITMHANDPLAHQDRINLSDLDQDSLMLLPRGHVSAVDKIYESIKDNHLQIQLDECDVHYTIETFNQFMAHGQYFLTLECWHQILPGLVSRPLAVPWTIPYGFIVPSHPTDGLQLFLQALLAQVPTINPTKKSRWKKSDSI